MAVRWSDLPKWRKTNGFIRSGYRKTSYSYKRSLKDLSSLHNDTVNIWVHVLAVCLFMGAVITFLLACDSLAVDVVVVVISFVGFIVKFGMTAIHHLFSNHSRKVTNYFGFHSNQSLRTVYMSSTTGAAIVSAADVWLTNWSRPRGRSILSVVNSALACPTILPAIHLLMHAERRSLCQRTVLASFATLGFLAIIGGCFYLTRIPERAFRGVFDIYGASRQILHVMLILGAIVYQVGLLVAREHWRTDLIQEHERFHHSVLSAAWAIIRSR